MLEAQKYIKTKVWNPDEETSSNQGGSWNPQTEAPVYPEQTITAPRPKFKDLQNLNTEQKGILSNYYNKQQDQGKNENSDKLGRILGVIQKIASPLTNPVEGATQAGKELGTGGKEILQGKFGEGATDIASGALKGAMSIGSIANPEMAAMMPVFETANEVLPEGVNKWMNKPATALSEALGGQVNPNMKKVTDLSDQVLQLLGFVALHKLGGKATDLLKGEDVSRETGVQNENQNQETNFISIEQGESSIDRAANQAERGTPQGNGEGQKEAPQTLKWIEKEQTTDIGTNSRETARETQNSGTPEGEPTSTISEEPKEVNPTSKNQRVGSLKPIEGTGETKQRGLAKNTEAAAIAAGITKGFENLPEYKVLSNAPQIQKASQIIANDVNQAVRMATGKEKAPDDVLPGFLYAGLKDKALKGELPPETLQELAQSDWLAKQGTTAGQIVQSFRNVDPLDPIKSLNDIVKVREENFAKRTGRESIGKTRDRVVNQIASETKKNNLQFKDWSSFIKSIECV